MSGKENYVKGAEAEHFFSSIAFTKSGNIPLEFQPPQGGFSVMLPQEPLFYLNETGAEERWEYQAVDTATGNAYLLMKQSVYNYDFLEQDSFDLGLVEASFHNADLFSKQVSRKQLTLNDGLPALEVTEKLKDSSLVKARYFISGPHYYLVAVRIGKGEKEAEDYLNSFAIKPFIYPASKSYSDSFLHASLSSPVLPDIDTGMRKLAEQVADDAANGNNASGYINYWPKPKRGIFQSASTGEMISVRLQQYPLYYYIRDSAKFWKTVTTELLSKQDMKMAGEIKPVQRNDYAGMRFSITDTGTARLISHLLILKNNFLYDITGVGDTATASTSFIKGFFDSFKPDLTTSRNLYDQRLNVFFNDLFSNDSAVQNRAQQSIGNIYYGVKGLPLIMDALSRLNTSDKKYVDTKSRLIAELGYIKDAGPDTLLADLQKIYKQTADTALFQNEIVKALSRLKTKASYEFLKEIFLQDPPVFENNYEFNSMFENLYDSLKLSVNLFPELLRLSTIDNYKESIIDLLAKLADSGLIKPKIYKAYFPGIYVDAKVALKKQQTKDEINMQAETRRNYNNEPVRLNNYDNGKGDMLKNYSILLMPFYEKDGLVRSFFSKLLQSPDDEIRLFAVMLMLRNKRIVDDSLLFSLAKNDRYRASFFYLLDQAGFAGRIPRPFNTQHDLTRSFLTAENKYDRLDSMVFLSKRECSVKGKAGFVYFYKYRIKRDDQWKIAMAGLQPVRENEVNYEADFSFLTNVRLKQNEALDEQLNAELKKALFSFHKSARNFFIDSDPLNN